jgi:hypothetical protein
MSKPNILYNNRTGCIKIENKLYQFLMYNNNIDPQLCGNDPGLGTNFLKINEVGNLYDLYNDVPTLQRLLCILMV